MIIGAGVVGASIAYQLARRGARVHVLEATSKSATGVTSEAFGWVNLVNGAPSANRAAYRLRQAAIAEYLRLKTEFPEALHGAKLGSIVWRQTTAATRALVDGHRAEGASIELIDRKMIAEREPHICNGPELAAFSPSDLALDPVRLTDSFVRAAIAAGATTGFNQKVIAIEASGAAISGVRTDDQFIPANIVVLAAGARSNELLSDLSIDVGVESSPALLLRYSAQHSFLRHIVRTPRIEMRQASDNSLLVAKSLTGSHEQSELDAIGRKTLAVIEESFATQGSIAFLSATIGHRPTFRDGLPRLGFLPPIKGLFLAAGHPGVILAPLLARFAAEEIVDHARSPILPRL